MLLIDSLRFDYLLESRDDKQLPQNKFKQFARAYSKSPENFVLMRARADAPTMTVNRIPCIAAGNIPPKSALLQALQASTLDQDSVPKQLKLQGYKSYFAGDPLWTEFFPQEFTEVLAAKGFNLKDSSVDKKSIQFLKSKISDNNFDFFLAHLLSIDHMAHAYGLSDLRVAEQIQANDQLIMDIIDTIDDKTTLIILGDHGSRFSGVHGGGSEDETNTAIVAYNKKGFQKYHQKGLSHVMRSINETTHSVKQQDIAPTVSMLLGLPIPFSNMGQIISDFYPTADYPNQKEECKNAAFETQMLHDNYLNTLQIFNYFERVQDKSHLFAKDQIEEITKLAAEIKSHYDKITEMVKISQQCEPAFHENALSGTLKAQQLSEKVYKLIRGAGAFDMNLIYESYGLQALVLFSYILIIQYLYRSGHSEKTLSLLQGLLKNFKKIALSLGVLLTVGIIVWYYQRKILQCFTTVMIFLAFWFCGWISSTFVQKQIEFPKQMIQPDNEAVEVNKDSITIQAALEKVHESSQSEKINVQASSSSSSCKGPREDERLVMIPTEIHSQPILQTPKFFAFQAPFMTATAIAIIIYCLICVHLGTFKRSTYQFVDPASPVLVLLSLAYRFHRRFPHKYNPILPLIITICLLLFFKNVTFSSERTRICFGLALILDFVWSDIYFIVKKYNAHKAWGGAFLISFALLALYHITEDKDNYWFQVILPRIIFISLFGIAAFTFILFKNTPKKKSLQLCLILPLVLLQKSAEVISFAIVFMVMKLCNQIFKNAKPLNCLYPLSIAFLSQFGLHILKHTDFSIPTNFEQGFIGLENFNMILTPLMLVVNIMTSYILGLISLSNYGNQSVKVVEGHRMLPREHLQVIKKRNIIFFVLMFSIIYCGAAAKCYFWRYFFLEEAQEKLVMDFAIYFLVSLGGFFIF